jgi:hypothetical protein
MTRQVADATFGVDQTGLLSAGQAEAAEFHRISLIRIDNKRLAIKLDSKAALAVTHMARY